MVHKTCSPLPLTEISRFRPRMSVKEKVRRVAGLIEAAPESLRKQMIQAIQTSNDLNHLINESREMQREVCGHAALANLIDESLRLQYAVALYKTDGKHHELILSTLLFAESHRDVLELFLVEVGIEGFETVLLKLLESAQTDIFPPSQLPAQNTSVQNHMLSDCLLGIALTSQNGLNRMVAAKWLAYYTATADSCIQMLEQLLSHFDANIRAIAALYISFLRPQYPGIKLLLWQPVNGLQSVGSSNFEFNGRRGNLQKHLMQRLVDLSIHADNIDAFDASSREWAQFWQNQMSLTCKIDRGAFEKSIHKFYSSLFLPPPQKVLWFKSPRAAAIAAVLSFYAKFPERTKFKLHKISKPSRFIDQLVEVYERFPAIHDRSNSAWNFGRKSWRVTPEWEPIGLFWCGTGMLNAPPQRPRHLWDCVTETFDPLPDELNLVARKLQLELGLKVNNVCERYDFEESLLTAMNHLVDHSRLRMVGYRNLLKQFDVCPSTTDGLDHLMQTCPTFLPLDDIVIACDRPIEIHTNARGQLHRVDGPAIEYSDGWCAYYIDGVRVSPGAVYQPQAISADAIFNTWNVELRRVLMNRLGMEKFVERCKLEKIHEDEVGSLYRVPFDFEPLNLVHVKNKTVEADGSYRDYFLRVPPNMMTAREAVAWSFQLGADEYQPEIET